MHEIAHSPGFSYNENIDVLRVDERRVLAAETANDDALEQGDGLLLDGSGQLVGLSSPGLSRRARALGACAHALDGHQPPR